MNADTIVNYLQALGDPAIARHSSGYFKTGPGEYGEGDLFLGIRMPVIRKAVVKFSDSDLTDTERLLHSPYHEIRIFALILMVRLFSRGSCAQREAIYLSYLEHTAYINNWDLVDCSAYHIVGPWLERIDRSMLYELARSPSLWERRIAVIATLHYIKLGDFDDTLHLASMLLGDDEDLIHKAVGWMLREVGNRDRAAETAFLQAHAPDMPRTMLRYAIEKFTPAQRKAFMTRSPSAIS